jgi:hypothetical protein
MTAPLLDVNPSATVLTLGDNAYNSGTDSQFATCYDPTWGRAKARTRPAPGNHDYATSGAAGYFRYFGAAAGIGYYSFDLGSWHLISLNSEIDVSPASPQYQWLAADLAASDATCTLAYWHKPRFSAGTGSTHGDNAFMGAVYELLFDRGADVVLVAHSHTYQRFAPMAPDGTVDTARGLRNFVAGTGGRTLDTLRLPHTGLEVSNANTLGVLEMHLGAGEYSWTFHPVAGRTFTDSGTQACH